MQPLAVSDCSVITTRVRGFEVLIKGRRGKKWKEIQQRNIGKSRRVIIYYVEALYR
jgi:hypothetical protein